MSGSSLNNSGTVAFLQQQRIWTDLTHLHTSLNAALKLFPTPAMENTRLNFARMFPEVWTKHPHPYNASLYHTVLELAEPRILCLFPVPSASDMDAEEPIDENDDHKHALLSEKRATTPPTDEQCKALHVVLVVHSKQQQDDTRMALLRSLPFLRDLSSSHWDSVRKLYASTHPPYSGILRDLLSSRGADDPTRYLKAQDAIRFCDELAEYLDTPDPSPTLIERIFHRIAPQFSLRSYSGQSIKDRWQALVTFHRRFPWYTFIALPTLGKAHFAQGMLQTHSPVTVQSIYNRYQEARYGLDASGEPQANQQWADDLPEYPGDEDEENDNEDDAETVDPERTESENEFH